MSLSALLNRPDSENQNETDHRNQKRNRGQDEPGNAPIVFSFVVINVVMGRFREPAGGNITGTGYDSLAARAVQPDHHLATLIDEQMHFNRPLESVVLVRLERHYLPRVPAASILDNLYGLVRQTLLGRKPHIQMVANSDDDFHALNGVELGHTYRRGRHSQP